MTNPVLEAKITDIHSWWEVPCIAHFCSLFRASFNLIDFDIEDLEEALLTDDASDSGNTLIQELIVRLLRGYYGNNSISTFNYQMFLRRLFRQKCREFQCYNPFDNDMDFQFLPMRTKVEILHMLCDFRLDADDVLDILKDLDSDSLRVHPLGYDANKSAYWYFYGTRLYREDYPKKKKEDDTTKKKRKGKKGRNKEEESDEEVELGSGTWHVVCFTESDWERLALNTEDATDKNEQTLHQIIEEDFLPEIPKLFQEKERLQRKRFLELHPRKSSRIESIKRRKEEETQYIDKYKRAFPCDDSESEADSEKSAKKAKNARYERWKNRNSQKEEGYDSDNVNSDSESLHESVKSFNQKSGFIVGRGRQTNNSLSSATGEILIQSAAERSRSPEWFDSKLEDLHIGMYKVLNKLKEHEDSWPFLQPVNEDEAPNYYKVVKSPMSLQKMEDKLDSGRYKSLAEFKHDFHLILANCKQYNGSRNEYTLMGENLERVFNACVNRYIVLSASSDGEDGAEANDFPELTDSIKKKKRRKHKRTSSKITVEADKENERKPSSLDVVSTLVEARTVEDTLSIESRTNEQKPVKRGKGRPPKNSSAFDALDIIAEQTLRDINKWLDDTPKYAEFCSASNSPPPLSPPKIETPVQTPSPLPLIITEPSPPLSIAPKTTSVVNSVPPPVRLYKHKDPNKKRSVKENHHKHLQMIKQGRRDIQRTIDRLQPGKSKGNLISTIGKTQLSSKPTLNDELSISAKTKENSVSKSAAAAVENTLHRPKPMLSLGSVLSHDVINLDAKSKKHTFSDNDSVPSDEEEPFSENDETSGTANVENELQAENLALDKPCAEPFYSSISEEQRRAEEKVSMDVVSKSDSSNEAAKSATSTNAERSSDKPTPNLSAWFKAFGAPKTQLVSKRKNDGVGGGVFNEQPGTPSPNNDSKDDLQSSSSRAILHAKTTSSGAGDDDRYDLNEPPPPTPGRFFTYDEERDSRPIPSLPSPDVKPLKRQRKLSTGSSVSERSSFSQDPNDPLNSPHPSLDDSVYQSPQPYHQSPIHSTGGALKVGFYQDTFPKGGSDKSNSCSPREPVNSCSPQHPLFSPHDSIASPRGPRDLVAASPHGSDVVASPHDPGCGLQIASPRNAIASPRYASVSPRDSFAESMHSPAGGTAAYTKSPPTYSHSCVDPQAQLPPRIPAHTEIDRSASPFKIFPSSTIAATSVEKSSFSIYPVKKRISAELEHTTRQHDDSSESDKGRGVADKQSFEAYPTSAPQHILPPNTFSPSDSGSSVAAPTIPISLSHHAPHSHHPHFMDSYSDNLLLSTNPYFRKDMYVSSPAVAAVPPPSSVGQTAPRISPLFMQHTDASAGTYSGANGRGQSHYVPSPRQSSPLIATSSFSGTGVPLDFTAASTSSSTSPLPLTSKAASDSYGAQFHHSRFHTVSHSEGDALNFSNKNVLQSPSIYTNHHSANEMANSTMQSSLAHYPQPPSIPTSIDANGGSGTDVSGGGMHSSSEGIYRPSANLLDSKHNVAMANYHHTVGGGSASYSNAVGGVDYFNGSKTATDYRSPDLRYSNFSSSNDEKQYYVSAPPKNSVVDPGIGYANHRLGPNGVATTPSSSSSNLRFDAVASYHNHHHRGGIFPPPPQSAPPPADLPTTAMPVAAAAHATAAKSGRKSKKKKATAAATAPSTTESAVGQSAQQNAAAAASMYSHFLSGSQTASSVAAAHAAAAAAAAASQEMKHNGLIASGAFNFGTSPSVVQKEYHQYFDNLRNQRYFGGGGGASVADVPSSGPVVDKVAAPPHTVSNHSSSSSSSSPSPSFQFLSQRSTPPFSLAAQAFMNANATAPPCGPPPPSIYSSPYLQRPPEELLRPMMLSQGLMSAHTGPYPPPPHGYINMHDPINRSPWL